MIDPRLYAQLKEEDPEFCRLAEQHQEYDRQIGEYDRIYYLTSDQERKRKDLQKRKLILKDQMHAIMHAHATAGVLHR
jgi:uncharacterized protein YdcH (DUF465 family)